MLVTNPTPRFVLRGENGSFIKYGMDIQEEDLASGKSPLDSDWGVDPESNAGSLYLAEEGRFREERVETLRGDYPAFYKQLKSAILENKEVPVSPVSAKNVIRIIEKSIESSRERRALQILG
jgi:predicted dehydrogenase